MAEHVCHANGCGVVVPRRMLMCKPHWFMVPNSLRETLWAAYAPGQERRMDPTPEYLDAAMACVNAVADREGIGR